MKKPKRVVGPFTTEWGNTIQPGQKVFAITTCSHQTCVMEVEYVGYVERDSLRSDSDMKEFYKSKRQYVQVRRACHWTRDTTIISTLVYNRIIPVESSAVDLIKLI